jgi:hypothetical protein
MHTLREKVLLCAGAAALLALGALAWAGYRDPALVIEWASALCG